MKQSFKTLNVEMTDCCCYTCGAGSVETIEKEHAGLDPITKKPTYDYFKYEWHSLDDFDEANHFENVAWTKNNRWGQSSLVARDEDSEPSTKEEYDESF